MRAAMRSARDSSMARSPSSDEASDSEHRHQDLVRRKKARRYIPESVSHSSSTSGPSWARENSSSRTSSSLTMVAVLCVGDQGLICVVCRFLLSSIGRQGDCGWKGEMCGLEGGRASASSRNVQHARSSNPSNGSVRHSAHGMAWHGFHFQVTTRHTGRSHIER